MIIIIIITLILLMIRILRSTRSNVARTRLEQTWSRPGEKPVETLRSESVPTGYLSIYIYIYIYTYTYMSYTYIYIYIFIVYIYIERERYGSLPTGLLRTSRHAA